MVDGAIDVCNFDASWSGGPTEWRRVASMALTLTSRWAITRSRRWPPTCSRWCPMAPTSNVVIRTAIRSGGTSSPTDPSWSTGELPLPDGPGLGWELDEDYIEHYRVGPCVGRDAPQQARLVDTTTTG
ncbi:enolase C-terminal domain-like protein [Capillimicrobium parvum]|uniref:enolase C-terminal domain-like protein n=1 Tax=Capillimicrobium parvum TaxID=2884022 RepID=UPI00389942E2